MGGGEWCDGDPAVIACGEGTGLFAVPVAPASDVACAVLWTWGGSTVGGTGGVGGGIAQLTDRPMALWGVVRAGRHGDCVTAVKGLGSSVKVASPVGTTLAWSGAGLP